MVKEMHLHHGPLGWGGAQILRLKCTKSFVDWGSAQTPLGELTVFLQTT